MKNSLVHIPEQHVGDFHLRSQYVSFENENLSLEKVLTTEELKIFSTIKEHDLKPLIALNKKYPDQAQIYNLLIYYYLKRKKLRCSERLIKKSYRACKDSLITRINFADQCIRKKRSKKVLQIFENKFDLRDICPERETFHISEFRGFMNVMGYYFLSKKNKEIAHCYHYMASKVDPKHPSTILLGNKLIIPTWKERFFGKT